MARPRHELHHLRRDLAAEDVVGPHGRTFEDEHRAVDVRDTVVRLVETGKREEISYR